MFFCVLYTLHTFFPVAKDAVKGAKMRMKSSPILPCPDTFSSISKKANVDKGNNRETALLDSSRMQHQHSCTCTFSDGTMTISYGIQRFVWSHVVVDWDRSGSSRPSKPAVFQSYSQTDGNSHLLRSLIGAKPYFR